MGGGIIQLVSTGVPDLYLTGDPQITWFKVLYRRYTEFSMSDCKINITDNLQFGSTSYINIGQIADKLNKLTLVVDIPTPEFTIKIPTVKTIKKLLLEYGIDYTKIKGLPQDDNICITYEILFGKKNNGPLALYLINNTLVSNFAYNIKLDVLDYYLNLYDLVDDKNIGKYIAIKANNIEFNSYSNNIDPEGYLLLTDIATRELINIFDTDNTINWDEMSFVYSGFNDDMDRTVIETSFPTIDKLIRIYPRQFGTYETVSSVSDFKKYVNDGKRHHIIISTQYIKKCKKYNIALYERYSKIEPNNNIDVNDIYNTYIQQKNRPLLFNNISLESLFYKNDFEIGIYTFNIDNNVSDTEYLNIIRQQLNKITIPISIEFIDHNITELNRYDLNENVIYDPEYIVSGEQTSITNESEETGFWIVKVSDLDISIDDITKSIIENNNINISIKLTKIGTNMSKLGFPSYKVIRKWDKSIVYNVKKLLGSAYDKDDIDEYIKIDNMVSGITTISKIVRSIYDVPNVALSYTATVSSDKRNIIPSFNDIINFHSFVIAIQDDLLNNNTETRNYKLIDEKLHNSVTIKKEMYNKLITDIIYVDAKKLGFNFMETNTQFFRKKYMDDIKIDEYIPNSIYKYDNNIIESIEYNKNIIYRYSKFLLFGYHIENISRLTDIIEIYNEIKKVSKMLLHIPINPININPEIENPNINDNKDITTENIRFTSDDINYGSSVPYQDDTIIENMDNIYRNPLYGENDYIDSEYIYAGRRYAEKNDKILNKSVFKDGTGTCINREIEFYHTLSALDLSFDENHVTENVYNHIIEILESSYDNSKDYKNTYSFRLANEYLEKYYKNIELISANVNIYKIITDVLLIIETGFISLLIKYNKYAFLILANNTYNDSEIEPQYTTINDNYITYIDYKANYIKEYTGGDCYPALLRAKYFNGIDINYRLFITYIFTKNFNSIYKDTYDIKSKFRILNYRNKKITEPVINNSTFKDIFTINIDNQINNNDNDIMNIITFGTDFNEYMNYEYWRDFSDYMTNNILPIIKYDLNDGYNINDADIGYDFTDIIYNTNTFILNHSSIVLTWYYGDKLQFILENIFNTDGLTYEYPAELIKYDDIPISHVDDFENTLVDTKINEPINKGYLYKGINSDGKGDILTLRFMGTDVRLNPECQIHGKIRELPDNDKLFKLFDFFMVRNNEPGKSINPNPIDNLDILDQCPLCFKTYCYMILFNNTIRNTLFNNDNNRTHITDTDKINDAVNDSLDNSKIIFFARPEPIQYDDVTRTYFHTNSEFTVYRLVTILFRYSRMINNIVLMNNNDFNNFKIKMNNNVNNIEFYDKYINYLTEIRVNALYNKFQTQIKSLIKIIGFANTDILYDLMKNKYDSLSTYTPAIYDSKVDLEIYLPGLSFISSKYGMNMNSVKNMIKNIKYAEPEATLVRHQLYRGNMSMWITIQQKIIENYNNYFNNILNPNISNLDIDISDEIYAILSTSIAKNNSYTENIIDYYKLSQNRTDNNFNNSITKMITTCREFMIYYMMILYRYKSMSNLLSFTTITLEPYQYYYNFTENIFAAYLKNIKDDIANFKKIDINLYNNSEINNRFYEKDTSRYYYINTKKFNKRYYETGIQITGNEYELFDYKDNYDIRQVFTSNQYNNLLRMIGVHEEYLLEDNIQKIIINYNNDYERYTKFIDNDILDDTHIYNYENTNIIYENNTINIEKNIVSKTYINRGIFTYIWNNCPTISTVMYDTFYNKTLLKTSNVTTNNNFDTDIIDDRIYTNSLFTSPYNYIRNKLIFSPVTIFSHTENLKEWEYNLYASGDTNSKRMNDIRGVYNTYQYLFGTYKYVDIRIKFKHIYNLIFNEKKTSIVESITTYTNIVNGLINNLVKYIKKVSNQQLSILLSQAITKYLPELITWGNKLKDDIKIYENELEFKFFGEIIANEVFKEEIKNIISDMITNTQNLFPRFTELVINLPITIITDNIQLGKTSEEIITILNYNNTRINSYVTALNTLFINVDSKLSLLENTAFVNTNIDNRIYAPPQLYALKSVSYFNSFETYNDAITLLASAIISLVSPKSAQQQISTIETANILYIDEITGVAVVATSVAFGTVPILLTIDNMTRENIYIKSKQAYIDSADTTLQILNKRAYLNRYVIKNKKKIAGIFDRYMFINTIAGRDMNLKVNNVANYQEYKQKLLEDKEIKRAIVHNNIKTKESNIRDALLQSRQQNTGYIILPAKPLALQFYIGTEFHNNLVGIFNRKEPNHAWVRYLGYRLIENVSIIIDGEEIDSHSDELLLLLHKMNDNIEHERGINRMIGHIESMYKISKDKRPSLRLYIQFKFWFCKDYGNSLPLLNMLYSNIQLKIKLRKFEELFYMEKYAELKKPVKIKCHLLGNYIYLGDEERKIVATTRSHSIMERFSYSGILNKSSNNIENTLTTENGIAKNILSIRYHFTDPCKYMIWKVSFNGKHTSDISKLYWDKSNLYSVSPDGNIILKEIVKKTLISLNGKNREMWKDNTYFQILQPFNKKINSLDDGEFFYSFCLYPKDLQPSGTTNFTEIEDIRFLFEINNEIIDILKAENININIKMWTCSYNIFMAVSGFGALGFYGT